MRLETTEQLMSLITLYREHQAEIDRYPGAKMERGDGHAAQSFPW